VRLGEVGLAPEGLLERGLGQVVLGMQDDAHVVVCLGEVGLKANGFAGGSAGLGQLPQAFQGVA
jgi:hypothetical protein